jgi:hypothetical protein
MTSGESEAKSVTLWILRHSEARGNLCGDGMDRRCSGAGGDSGAGIAPLTKVTVVWSDGNPPAWPAQLILKMEHNDVNPRNHDQRRGICRS